MSGAIARKFRQVAGDAVLRRWLLRRALGRERPPPAFTPHVPPYLADLLDDIAAPTGAATDLAEANAETPSGTIDLALPGETVTVSADDPGAVFTRHYADLESYLAAQRFAWLPLQHATLSPGWVAALWTAWRGRFGTPDSGWAWHPYTAAERAINILDFARRHGLPAPRDDTVAVLAAHATAIAARLEYFGDNYTSNHLSNNGRGLYRIGLELGLPGYADLGRNILLAEAGRLFGRAGVLREGSTHYHLLLTRNYTDAWLAARRQGRPEAATLREIVSSALRVLPHFDLPGGLPLIGDISPDCPPSFLTGLLPSRVLAGGWMAALDDDDRRAFAVLRNEAAAISPDRLGGAGWHRFASGPWTMLCHAAPKGWPPMPGHGHQDLGGFELHYEDAVLFHDPGRGAYGDTSTATEYVGAAMHNALTVDGAEPYPPNRPYYSEDFRRRVGGPPPRAERERAAFALTHHGFTRLRGVGAATRRWIFADDGVTVADDIAGSGRHRVTRYLQTTGTVAVSDDIVTVELGPRTFTVQTDGEVTLHPATRWLAYGVGIPATTIEIKARPHLPFNGRIRVTAR